MKRLTAIAVLTAALFASLTAFAADDETVTIGYTGGSNHTVKVAGADSYSTVMIKDSSGSIVYVNQADSSFSGITDFLMKDSNSRLVGKYTAVFGSSSGSSETKTFYVGVPSEKSYDVPMTRLSSNLEKDGTYSTGFFRTVSANEYGNYNSLKVGYNNGSQDVWGGFALKDNGFPKTTGEGDLTLIFELNEIEADEIGSVSVFLSLDVVGSGNANQE